MSPRMTVAVATCYTTASTTPQQITGLQPGLGMDLDPFADD
jgi:hypothetical protein